MAIHVSSPMANRFGSTETKSPPRRASATWQVPMPSPARMAPSCAKWLSVRTVNNSGRSPKRACCGVAGSCGLCIASAVAAARGTSLIVYAVNRPGYRNWGSLVLPMLDSTILAASSAGARILSPGTII